MCLFTLKFLLSLPDKLTFMSPIFDSDLYKMVCTENDTSLDIKLPVVMIPKSGGDILKKSMAKGKGEVSYFIIVEVSVLVCVPEIFFFLFFFFCIWSVGRKQDTVTVEIECYRCIRSFVVGWLIASFSFVVELLLYSPKRPVMDFSEIFLWLMAVGTILCAALWEDFVASDQTDERYNEITRKVR